jgi:hypothetical protein
MLWMTLCQIKISEREKIVSPNIQIHDSSLFWFGTGTSIKYVTIKVFKLVLWVQTSLLGRRHAKLRGRNLLKQKLHDQ